MSEVFKEQSEEEKQASPLQRFSDLVPADELSQLSVTIIGAGGIGAPAALSLAKMGVGRICIYDPDVVDTPNLGTQMYSPKHMGQPKVIALKRFLKQQAPWCEVHTVHDWFTNQAIDTPVFISAVDSLEIRRQLWQHVYNNSDVRLLIDPRMGLRVLNVISVDPKIDKRFYEKTLEGNAVEAPCTAKATFYTGLVAGGLVAQAVLAWVLNERKDQYVDYSLDLAFINLLGMTRDQLG